MGTSVESKPILATKILDAKIRISIAAAAMAMVASKRARENRAMGITCDLMAHI